MTKITDDDSGKLTLTGLYINPLQRRAGKNWTWMLKSQKILTQAGADPHSFYVTHVRADHHGGTAGIGRVVNADHETEINRLFASDASVLPKAPGAPPVLTIVAMSKRFSKKLTPEYL